MPSLHEVTEDDGTVLVRGEGFSVTFDRAAGTIASWRFRGRDLLLSGPRPNFWRAPNDNDFGGNWQLNLKVWKGAGEAWRVEDSRVDRTLPGEVRLTFSGPLVEGAAYTASYTVRGDGEILVEAHLIPGEKELQRMPRFGMRMTLPKAFSRLAWYGRGPHESYWDRKAGAPVGRYEGTVSEQLFPYVRPQETGNKTDVRWLVLRDATGTGLAVLGMPTVSASALPVLQEDLDPGETKAQRHAADLVERDLVSLEVDYLQMGVGGVNSWGFTALPKYSLPYAEYSYRYRLRPVTVDDSPR